MSENIFEKLKQLIIIDSCSNNIDGVNKVGRKIQEILSDLPLIWNEVSEDGAAKFIVARTKVNNPSKPVILLSAHMDVVLHSDEVEMFETENKLFGSGVQDMKASLVVIVELLKILHQMGELKNIIFALSPEEEIGTPHYRSLIKKLAQEADYVMVFESTLNSSDDPDLLKRSIVTSRRGIHVWGLTLEGPGGHSGVIIEKNKRLNTNLKMSEIILELESLADYSKPTTLNVGKFEGGKCFNILSPKSSIEFETRFHTEDEHQRVRASVESIVKRVNEEGDYNAKLISILDFPSMAEKQQNFKFVSICEHVAKKLGIPIELERRGGGSEASLYQHFNPSASVLDGFGVRGGGEHTTLEFMYKNSLYSTIEFNLEVIKNILAL